MAWTVNPLDFFPWQCFRVTGLCFVHFFIIINNFFSGESSACMALLGPLPAVGKGGRMRFYNQGHPPLLPLPLSLKSSGGAECSLESDYSWGWSGACGLICQAVPWWAGKEYSGYFHLGYRAELLSCLWAEPKER